jgi:hypothetical protein
VVIVLSEQLFNNLFTKNQVTFSTSSFAIAILVSLGLGFVLAMVYKYRTLYTKEFVLTLILLPSLISIIIFMVNGNLGTSVAVAGTFSLIRFRSAAGGSKELLSVFMATAIGLAVGMGYIVLAIVFTLILSGVLIAFEQSSFVKPSSTRRQVQLVVPMDFDYELLIEGMLSQACRESELVSVKSKAKTEKIQLDYLVDLKQEVSDKQFVDSLKTFKADLDIALSKTASKKKIL